MSYKRNENNNWRSIVNRSTPLVGSLAGVIIILTTVINVAESVNTVVMVAIGILLLGRIASTAVLRGLWCRETRKCSMG